MPARRPLTPLVVTPLVVAALLVAVPVRFVATSALWLDEAQSVAIARLPVPDLLAALREDGHPPGYYLLLHVWLGIVGDGSLAVRALSGVVSVAALPVCYVLAKRVLGPTAALPALLLLTSSPFAIRYATEARMYALVMLLVLLGGLAFEGTRRRRGLLPVAALGLLTGALLLTHYWGFFLLAVAGGLAVADLRRPATRAGGTRLLAGLAIGVLAFLPWLPSLRFQLAHTGTPWAGRAGLRALPETLAAWAGTAATPGAYLHLLLVVIAFAGVGVNARRRWPGLPPLVALGPGVVLLGVAASAITGSAFAPRYTAVALPAFVLLAAAGTVAITGSRRWRAATLTAAVALGLLAGVSLAGSPRTQAGQVGVALRTRAHPGDVLVSCPDQLGPSVTRVAPAGLASLAYPALGDAGRVDWVDYLARIRAAHPRSVGRRVIALAPPNRTVWLVTSPDYRGLGTRCQRLEAELRRARPQATVIVPLRRRVFEHMQLVRFAGR